MAVRKSWVALFVRDDDLAAGPFDDQADADRFVDGYDDVYSAEVDPAWLAGRINEITKVTNP